MAGRYGQPSEADLNAEAQRFLRWAESDRWNGASPGAAAYGGPTAASARAPPAQPSHFGFSAQGVFDSLDRNRDGVISREEFETAYSSSPAPTRGGSPYDRDPYGAASGLLQTPSSRLDLRPTSPRPLSDIYGGPAGGSGGYPSPYRGSPTSQYQAHSPPRVGLGPTYGRGGELGVEGDPWKALLDSSDGEFVAVPAATLQRLRRAGEAQLAEIEALRAELASEPELRADIVRLEAQLAELESSSVLAANEAELRRQEAENLDLESSRLRSQLQALERRRDALREEVELMESWLPDSVALPTSKS